MLIETKKYQKVKVVYKDKIIHKDKIIYKDVIKFKDKIIYKEIPKILSINEKIKGGRLNYIQCY